MNYEAKQWKECAERMLFRLGTRILGERGLVAKLYHKVGLEEAGKMIDAAAGKSDPREYIGGILRKRQEQQGPALSEAEIERLWSTYKAKQERSA